MKKVRLASMAVVSLLAWTVVRGDVRDELDPNLQYDQDGVPLDVTPHVEKRLTPDQITALRKQQAQAALDKDWLLRGYEKQLQSRNAANASANLDGNLYFQLSTNKDLAKLAAVPLLDDGSDAKPTYHTGAAEANHPTAALRGGGSPAGSPRRGFFLKPLITPLSAPEAAGLQNFYSTLPTAALSPFYSNGAQESAPVKAKTRRSVSDEDPTDIETPGMIAAGKDPLSDPGTSDLTLDLLPGESVEHAKAHQDNDSLLQLPLPMDANQLHQAQAASLSPKNATGASKLPPAASTPVLAKPIPVNDEDAPMPASQMPVISPIRAPIANPYDILNR